MPAVLHAVGVYCKERAFMLKYCIDDEIARIMGCGQYKGECIYVFIR